MIDGGVPVAEDLVTDETSSTSVGTPTTGGVPTEVIAPTCCPPSASPIACSFAFVTVLINIPPLPKILARSSSVVFGYSSPYAI